MDIDALQKENQQLRHAVDELSFLNELARAIGSMLDSKEIMQTVIRKSIRAIKAEQGSIVLVSGEEGKEMKTLVRSIVSSTEHKPYSLCQNLIGWMQINKKSLKIDDMQKDKRFSGTQWNESIKSIACVPLTVKSTLIGIFSVYNKKGDTAFTDDDVRFLSIIAGQSAQVVENARLYEEEREYLKLREESRMAREIQMNILPKSNPDITGYDIAGKSIPALSVGGDYYDFIPLENNRIAIGLGDISGKGMPAALLMSNLQATVRGQSLNFIEPHKCICRVNDLVYRSTDMNKYATLFYGVLNPLKNEFIYTNAGHNPPLFYKRKAETILLKTGGPVVGFMEGMHFKDDVVIFEPKDVCVIYSDGVTEAMDIDENEFGEERLHALIMENMNFSSARIIETIIEAVNEHAKGAEQSDDITLVVIKKLKV